MQAQANPQRDCGCDLPPTESEDARIQRAVLAFVLDQHPATLTIGEIAQEFRDEEAERAIRDLVGVGLLRCEGASVLPTRAALHADRLEAE